MDSAALELFAGRIMHPCGRCSRISNVMSQNLILDPKDAHFDYLHMTGSAEVDFTVISILVTNIALRKTYTLKYHDE